MRGEMSTLRDLTGCWKEMTPGSEANWEMQGEAWVCLATASWGQELSSPQHLPHLKRSCLTYLSPPQLKGSSTLCSKRNTCPTRVQLDLQWRLHRGRRGTLPPSGLDTSTPAAWPESLRPSRRNRDQAASVLSNSFGQMFNIQQQAL